MSLAPGEQRTLAEIESDLCGSDPAFAAMFTVLADVHTGEPPARECLPRHAFGATDSARAIIVLAVGMLFLIACIVTAVITTSHATPPHDGHGPGVSLVGTYVP